MDSSCRGRLYNMFFLIQQFGMMLLDSPKTASLMPFSLGALALAAYGIYSLVTLIVRHLSDLAYAEDDKALS